jgi:DNA-binding GntR family transcriptional regulator
MIQIETTLAPDDRKDTIASQLVRSIREDILCGELAPGEKINIERLRERLHVSLSPLREALSRLSSGGLLEAEDNRGFRVPSLSLSQLAEVTQLRVQFEPMALRRAIVSGDIEWEEQVIQALHRVNRITRDPKDRKSLEDWESAHGRFHHALIAGCGMPLLLQFCAVLHNHNDRYRRILLKTSSGDRNVGAEHTMIAEASVSRRADDACSALREHIERTGANLHRHLSKRLADG